MVVGLLALVHAADGLGVPPLMLEYRNRNGLTASFNGVPVIRGSLIEVSDAVTGKPYFRTSVNDQRVEKLAGGDLVVKFESPDGRLTGSQSYTRTPNGFKVDYRFLWTGVGMAKVDWSLGQVWARPFINGSLKIDNSPTRDLHTTPFTAGDMEGRKYGPPGKFLQFDSTFGRLTVNGESREWTIFDARGYKELWANKDESFWLGQQSVTLMPNRPVVTSAEVAFEPGSFNPREVTASPEAETIDDAIVPDNRPFPIIPQPKQMLFDRDIPGFEVTPELKVDVTDTYYGITDEFIGALRRRWDVPDLHAVQNRQGNVIVRIQDLGLGPEGYEVRVSPTSVLLLGQDYLGLVHACTTVGFLSYAKDGKLWLPCGSLRDWPSIAWRGVHLFGGPEIKQFHDRLAHRVLAPLKFNKVVLQCERTKWDSFPGIETSQFNSREDLKATFDMYRRLQIDRKLGSTR